MPEPRSVTMSFQKAGHAVAVETAQDEVKDAELVVVVEVMVLEVADNVVMMLELVLVATVNEVKEAGLVVVVELTVLEVADDVVTVLELVLVE